MVAAFQNLWNLVPEGLERRGGQQAADVPNDSVPDGVTEQLGIHEFAGYIHSLKVSSSSLLPSPLLSWLNYFSSKWTLLP